MRRKRLVMQNGRHVIQNNVPLFKYTGTTVPTTTTTTGPTTVQCVGGTEPSIALTVTGATGTITWCGQTWTLPGDSGVTKQVCPTSYSKGGLAEEWEYNGNELKLINGMIGAYPSNVRAGVYMDDGVNNAFSYRYGYTGYGWLGILWSPSAFQPLYDIDLPSTAGNYAITDDHFTSITLAGITYAWERGTNW